MDKNKYTEKCMLLLNTKQFKKRDNDPTKTTEGKIQRMLRRIKPKLSEHEYKVLYPSGSSPGKFYGTAKIHKVPKNGNIDHFESDLLYQTWTQLHTNSQNIYQRYYHLWENLNIPSKVEHILWR